MKKEVKNNQKNLNSSVNNGEKHYSVKSELALLFISLLGAIAFAGLFGALFLRSMLGTTLFVILEVIFGVVYAGFIVLLYRFKRD